MTTDDDDATTESESVTNDNMMKLDDVDGHVDQAEADISSTMPTKTTTNNWTRLTGADPPSNATGRADFPHPSTTTAKSSFKSITPKASATDDVLATSIKTGRGGMQARTATLHRVRFVDWSPSTITSLALTPLTWDPNSAFPYLTSLAASSSNQSSGREILAIGRQNGNIEIHGWIGGEGRLGQAMLPAASTNTKHSHSLKRHFRSRQPNRQGWVLIKVWARTLIQLSCCLTRARFRPSLPRTHLA